MLCASYAYMICTEWANMHVCLVVQSIKLKAEVGVDLIELLVKALPGCQQ
jgi:hypothetical protein